MTAARKLNRRFRLTIQVDDENEVVIESPLTIQFDITRNTDASVNNMTLKIKNLAESTRAKIFQDRFLFLKYRKIRLEAGYSELSLIFQGNLLEANSVRSGNDIDTDIIAMDGGLDQYNTKTSRTLKKDTTLRDVLGSLIGDFPNLTEGTIGDIEGDFKRPVVIEGNTFTLLDKYSNGQVFVDLEKVNILQGDEVLEGSLPLINSETGLLGTPKRNGAFLSVDTIFEPRVNVAQLLEIQSSVAPIFDGQYKVTGVKHSGIISDAVGGECRSTFNLLIGSLLFGRLQEA